MDRIDAMRAFARVVERRSFAQAGHDLVLPRSRISEAVAQLERDLGTSLLVRTTRKVTPTAEGESYYRSCLAILAAVDDAAAAVTQSGPAGPLKIDVHGTFARRFLLPALPDFLHRYPGIRLHVGEGDRMADLVDEGLDCVVRIGVLADSGLISRKLGMLAEGTYASPDYLARHGVPASVDDLHGHRMVGFVSSATRTLMPLEFMVAGKVRTVTLPVSATVSSAEMNACLARLGLGLIQVPRYRVAEELRAGTLVEVLPGYPPPTVPVHLLYPEGRQLSPRVRLFIDWASAEIAARLRTA